MALCLPRKRRATSLATRPRTLSVASITNHSCVTSAGLALKVFMDDLFGFASPAVGHDDHSAVGAASLDGGLLGGTLLTVYDAARYFPGAVCGKVGDSSRLRRIAAARLDRVKPCEAALLARSHRLG